MHICLMQPLYPFLRNPLNQLNIKLLHQEAVINDTFGMSKVNMKVFSEIFAFLYLLTTHLQKPAQPEDQNF